MNVRIKHLMNETRDETAIVIAELYNVHPSYVRKAVAGTLKPKKKSTSKKIENIRSTYNQYIKGKNNLISSLEQQIKIA